MEVHHHPHVEKKNFKEYFLEFLMIFLAVTMGFFAESLREHINDDSKEKEYIHSLIADLKSDQQVIAQHILEVKEGISMMDSLIAILDTPALVANNTGKLYYLARLAPRLKPLSTSSRTFEQLKNSGNFRLIQNISVSNTIMEYYEKFPIVHLLSTINESEFTEYKKIVSKVFNPAVMVRMEDVTTDGIKRISNNPPLRTNDYELFQEMSVYAVYMHGTKIGTLTADEEIRKAGAELIEYLQKEYHLESE
ncbi:MAG TPA: hypothetical protein VKT28_20430 [Puia sp.]|nr:hypothetical protein [Puia sp.]